MSNISQKDFCTRVKSLEKGGDLILNAGINGQYLAAAPKAQAAEKTRF